MNVFTALLACVFTSLAYGQFLQTGIFGNTLQLPFQNDKFVSDGLYDPQTNSISSGLLNGGVLGGQGDLKVQGWGVQDLEGQGFKGEQQILTGNSFRGRSHDSTRRYKRSPDEGWLNRGFRGGWRGQRWGGQRWRGRGRGNGRWGGRGRGGRRWGGGGRGGRGGRWGWRGRGWRRDKRSADNLLHLYSN